MVESVKNHPTKTNKSLSHGVWVASCASFGGFFVGCFHEFGVGMCGFYMGHPAPDSSNELNHWAKNLKCCGWRSYYAVEVEQTLDSQQKTYTPEN